MLNWLVTIYILRKNIASVTQFIVLLRRAKHTQVFIACAAKTHPSFYVESLRTNTPVSSVKRLKVRDVIANEVATVDPSTSLLDAAKRMVQRRIDAFIVTPLEKDEPFGIITQTDVVDLFADEVDIGKVTVGEVANKPLFIVSPGMPILYAAKMFRKAGVSHLAVFNGQEILGVISYSDVLNGLPNLMEQIYSEFD
jgi:signal-transduction protein with cAMP-binding, CBS, and nucleotidyltransferase domain